MTQNSKQSVTDSMVQELRRGSLVLVVLLNSEEPCYGYSLVEDLKERGVAVEQNTLYPLLRRLEGQGLLTSNWDTSTSRPRKYYRISDRGRAVAGVLRDEWRRLDRVIDEVSNDKQSH